MSVRQLTGQEIRRFSSGFGYGVGPLLGARRDGQPLLFSSVPDGSEVSCWDIRTGDRVWSDDEGMSGCNDTALVELPDGQLLLAVATEDGIEWWDALTGQHRPEMTWEDWTIWAVTHGMLPDGRPILLGVGHNGMMYRWDAVDGEELGASSAEDDQGSMMAVGFVPSPDGIGVAVSGDEAGQIWRWNAASGDQMGQPIPGHGSQVRIIQTLPVPEEPLFVSSDQEGVLKRWNAVTGTEVGSPIETGTEIYALAAASIDGAPVLFAAGADEVVRAWDAATGEPIGLALKSAVVSALTQADGTALLATSTAQGDIVVHECSFRTA
ncbi:WD40 repeat domain-containing protein [Streptomyces sp. NBC_01304]|uniref:WD40 repeat domain-containing protein n=1 Tax=Streptomyces sp. NBC_01304 TaxID=2903818 RepID=UPI002E119B7A|nr:WD40 repeat domain-containing protein [Streptomyces sp. NBC_01304]